MRTLKDDELLTKHEVGALLKLSPRTVEDWYLSGRLPRVYIGKVLPGRKTPVRFWRSDVEKLLG